MVENTRIEFGECAFLHSPPECPNPETLRAFDRENKDGSVSIVWYCDEGEEEARQAGIVLRARDGWA